jgi:hypothetical protein
LTPRRALREFPWPDPTFLTVELDVPTGLSAAQLTWLTGHQVQGQPPHAKGAGPTLGPMIADVLDYGIAIRGDDWLFWQPIFLPATPGEVSRTVSVDVERRRMRVLVAGAPQPDARIVVYEPSSDWTRLKTFTADAEGWVDAALSGTTFRLSCGTSYLELAWPPPASQTDLRFD